jgi:hypothetical protein
MHKRKSEWAAVGDLQRAKVRALWKLIDELQAGFVPDREQVAEAEQALRSFFGRKATRNPYGAPFK